MKSFRSHARALPLPWLVSSALCLAACTGSIPGDNEAAGGSGSDRSGGAGSPRGGATGRAGAGGGPQAGGSQACDAETQAPTARPGVLPLRRLTRFEYDNTVRDLLGDTTRPAAAFPADDVGAVGFATAINTSELMVTTALEIAEKLATSAVAKLDTLVPCASAANEACASEFVSSFGRRAFRRPLTAEERTVLVAVYSNARTQLGYDFKGGIRVVLTTMLQAPQFLYRWELGGSAAKKDADGTIALGPYELASRLSYFLWGSTPDAALLDAASAGKLASREEVTSQAKRLLGDARSRDMVADFFGQMMQTRAVTSAEKDTKIADWTAEVRASALAESRAFVQSVVLDGDGSWRTLLTAPYSYLDARTAKLYGVSGVVGSAPTKTNLPAGQRAGLLTQPAFLASQSGPTDGAMITPIRRGHVIRKRLLCQEIPPPLENVTARPSSGTTTRQRLSSHASDPQCAACHDRMDDLGFAMEGYDVVGRWRTTDNGAPVDTHGELSGVACGRPKFGGAVELAQRLADAPEVSDCLVQNLVRYATAREETDGEVAAMRASLPRELNVRDLMVQIASSEGFIRRIPSPGEVLQ